MNRIFPVFMIIALALIAFIITMSGGWPTFINVPSLLIVILLPVMASLMSFRIGELLESVRVAAKPDNYDGEAREKALVIQKAVSKNLDYTSIIAFLIGIVSMLANLNNEEYLASGLALALIIIVYALIIKFLIPVPMINALEKSLARGN